jgi:hypothetical protein
MLILQIISPHCVILISQFHEETALGCTSGLRVFETPPLHELGIQVGEKAELTPDQCRQPLFDEQFAENTRGVAGVPPDARVNIVRPARGLWGKRLGGVVSALER